MGKPDPKLDSLIERIVFGQDVREDEDVPKGDEGVVENLRLLSSIDRFHRDVHGAADETQISDPIPDSTQWGPLQLRGRLGRGGFGDVYRAWDPALEREVALKLLRPDVQERGAPAGGLLEEARTLAKVRHENVVSVFGVETHDDRPGYWMELVQGVDLEQRLKDQGPMNAEEAAQVGVVLCKALAALHAVGLVHRDVKTTNVVREQGGRLVLMDFGTAVQADPASPPTRLSGTPMYMAPEILQGQAPDPRTDIYSLGVLLYRLVTGAFPLDPMPIPDLMDAHAAGQRRPVRDVRPDLPSEFCAIVDRAIDPDPESRFPSVGELELALTGSRARPASSRRGFLIAAALAMLVVVGGTLMRSRDGGSGSVVVDASFHTLRDGRVVELADGGSVAVNDVLWLELTPSHRAYVYVLNRDADGGIHLLFPLSGYDLQNPLPAQERHQLPGFQDGARKAWRVSSASDREEFVILVGREPLDEFETSLAEVPEVAAGGSALALGDTQMDRLVRGVEETTDLILGPGPTSSGSDLFDAARRLGSTRSADGTWVRTITLFQRP